MPLSHWPVPAGTMDNLPANQGRQPEKAVQQEVAGQPVLVCRCQQPPEVLPAGRQRIHFLLRGGQMVKQSRENLPLFAHFHVHPPQAVYDPALPVQEDKVGVPSHTLHSQFPLPPLPHFVYNLKCQEYHPLQGWLLQGGQPSAQQVLAQKHAEHRRRSRIFPNGPGQVHPGLAGPGAQQQLLIAPQSQDDLIPGRLLNLFHPQAHNRFLQFPDYAGQADSIKWHRFFPPSLQQIVH